MATQIITMCVVSIFITVLVGSLGSAADASFQTELLKRIIALEKQDQKQVEKMKAMESRIEEQDNKLAVQEKTISDYKQKVAGLEQTVAVQEKTILDNKQRMVNLERTVTVQDETILGTKQRVVGLEQTVVELKLKHESDVDKDPMESNAGNKQSREIIRSNRTAKGSNQASERQRRALLNAEGPVVFQAVISDGEHLHFGVGQKLVFPTVMANVGGGYRNQHGIFTAPQPGIYIFSTSIMSDNRNHVEIQVNLVKNGQVLAGAYAHCDSGRYDQGSVTVATQMAAGDEVWVSVNYPSDTSLLGAYFDRFM